MSTQDPNAGGAGAEASGGAAALDAAAAQNQGEKVIKAEDHRRAIDDLMKYKRQATDSVTEITTLKSQLGELQTKVLEKDNDWKKIAENKDAEAKDWKQKYETSNKAFVGTQKFNAIQAKAVAAGLRPEAMADLELLGHEGVEVELTSSGRMIVSGVDDYVERLKSSRGHWFKTPDAPQVNSGGTGAAAGATGQITLLQILEKEKKVGSKHPEYEELVRKYQKQQAAKGRT